MRAALAAAALSYVYMRWVEARWLRVSRWDVPLSDGSDLPPIRVLHLSDLHASGFVSLGYLRRAIRTGLAHDPHLICLTGDFVSHHYHRWEDYAEVLQLLSRHAPTFACLGDHDGGRPVVRTIWDGYHDTTLVRQLLQRSGVQLLDNAACELEICGRPLRIAGLSDLRNGDLAPELAFREPAQRGVPTVVLCHNPDAKTRLLPYEWKLLLCGHTHGGQGCLPLIGAPFAPVEDKRFLEGLHQWRGRWIHITRGVGSVLGVRFSCRPEVSILTLR